MKIRLLTILPCLLYGLSLSAQHYDYNYTEDETCVNEFSARIKEPDKSKKWYKYAYLPLMRMNKSLKSKVAQLEQTQRDEQQKVLNMKSEMERKLKDYEFLMRTDKGLFKGYESYKESTPNAFEQLEENAKYRIMTIEDVNRLDAKLIEIQSKRKEIEDNSNNDSQKKRRYNEELTPLLMEAEAIIDSLMEHLDNSMFSEEQRNYIKELNQQYNNYVEIVNPEESKTIRNRRR